MDAITKLKQYENKVVLIPPTITKDETLDVFDIKDSSVIRLTNVYLMQNIGGISLTYNHISGDSLPRTVELNDDEVVSTLGVGAGLKLLAFLDSEKIQKKLKLLNGSN